MTLSFNFPLYKEKDEVKQLLPYRISGPYIKSYPIHVRLRSSYGRHVDIIAGRELKRFAVWELPFARCPKFT
jgi:hypothetical protein